jgi:hypothetical protein
MELLLDINSSPQIPPERRIDLTNKGNQENHSKSLKKLIQTVPHTDYATTVEQLPELARDLAPKDPNNHPISFLSADDVDDYLWELDYRLNLSVKSTLARKAREDDKTANSSANFALNNPTSVYNWLRKHAPKTFLQDLDKDKDKDDHANGDREDGGGGGGGGGGRKRKSTGPKAKRQSTAGTRKEKKEAKERGKERARESAAADSMDWEEDRGYDVQTVKGKRKRNDDDTGYRPKGGSSRPTKKRKSGGAASKRQSLS